MKLVCCRMQHSSHLTSIKLHFQHFFKDLKVRKTLPRRRTKNAGGCADGGRRRRQRRQPRQRRRLLILELSLSTKVLLMARTVIIVKVLVASRCGNGTVATSKPQADTASRHVSKKVVTKTRPVLAATMTTRSCSVVPAETLKVSAIGCEERATMRSTSVLLNWELPEQCLHCFVFC